MLTGEAGGSVQSPGLCETLHQHHNRSLKTWESRHSLYDPVLAAGEVILWRVDEGKAEVEH